MAGDQVRLHGQADQAKPLVERVLPQSSVPLRERVATEHVVDQNIEPTGLAIDPLEEVLHLVGHEVVDADRYCCAALLLDQIRRLLDRLRPSVVAGSRMP